MSGANEKQPVRLLQPGWLRDRLEAKIATAHHSGVLQPLPAGVYFLEEQGIRFVVRILSVLSHKLEAGTQQDLLRRAGADIPDPFLPPEPGLFLAQVSDTHLVLLNKYNVLERHLLVVTREFEEQESLLTFRDFCALWTCLAEMDGLAFYNAGKRAGASQRHKHLQLVSLPLAPEGFAIPIQPALDSAECRNGICTTPLLPFAHGLVRHEAPLRQGPEEAARQTQKAYQLLLVAMGLVPEPVTIPPVPQPDKPLSHAENREVSSGPGRAAAPEPGRASLLLPNLKACNPGAYNLLVTRNWVLLVPRSQESFETISINSLGFAGALLVRTPEELERLRKRGPFAALQAVGMPAARSPAQCVPK